MDIKKQLAAQEALKRGLERQTVTSGKLAFKNDDYIIENYGDTVEMLTLLFNLPSFKKKGSRQREKINGFIRDEIVEELDGLNFLVGIDSVSKFLDKYRGSYLDDRNLQKVEGCVISIDHRNGYIEAMVGGSEFTSINQLNRAMQAKRQPGSSIKPLIYSAAIESGEFTARDHGAWTRRSCSSTARAATGSRRTTRAITPGSSAQEGAGPLDQRGLRPHIPAARHTAYNEIPGPVPENRQGRRKDERIPRNFSIALGSMEVSPLRAHHRLRHHRQRRQGRDPLRDHGT